MLLIISLIFCTRDIFFSFIYFFVNIVYYVVHIVCEVDVIANSLVLYLPFCSTLNKKFFSLSLFSLLSSTIYIQTFLNINRDLRALVKFATRSWLVSYVGKVVAPGDWGNIILNVIFRG